MNLTKSQKKQHLKNFIVYSINKFNKIPSFYYLERVIGRRPNLIINELIQSKVIILTKKQEYLKTFRNKTTGNLICETTQREFKTKLVIDDIRDNFYYQKLKNLKAKPERKCKVVDMILSSVAETLQKTTIDGSPVSTDVIFKKGRFYSEYTNFEKSKRNRLKIDGEETSSIDIKSSVLQLMVKSGQFDDEKLLNDLNSEDFWSDMATRMGVSRRKLKKDFIKNIFGKQTKPKYYREYKSFFSKIFNIRSRHGYKMVYQLYQSLELDLMSEIYKTMILNKKDFLPMHDCIIVKNSDVKFVEELFKSYDINVDKEMKAETDQKQTITPSFKDRVMEIENNRKEMAIQKEENRVKAFSKIGDIINRPMNIKLDEDGRIIN